MSEVEEQQGRIDLKNLPLYEESTETTVRVSGGTKHINLASFVLNRLRQHPHVDLTYIGAAAAWQAGLAQGVIHHTNPDSVSFFPMYVRVNTTRGERKIMVVRLVRTGKIVDITH